MRVSRKAFDRCVVEGVSAIPEEFRQRIANIAFVVENEPTEAQLSEHGIPEGETLLALFEGVTLGEEKSVTWHLPPKITIFKRPIEAEARTPAELKRIVRETVWHEVAHYLGMEEYEVRAAEARRRGRT